jgi:hypothetical protein
MLATSVEQQFAGDRRMLWIASEWQYYSARLADWALEHLANRRDVWSQYTLRDGEVRVVMLPIKERRRDGTDMVTETKLKRHFAGRAVSHLIGLHSISDHRTAKWFAIDIDLHDEKAAKSADVADANLAASLRWTSRLRDAGLDPFLLDSNGVGGYHIWVLLDREYPLADVYDYADSVRADWQQLGLPRKPEIFPPKRVVDDDDLPYTLRLPGRHHTRRHFTRVRNFDPLVDGEWLEGGEAIEALLAARPSKLPGLKKRSKRASKAPVKEPSGSGSRKSRPRVCVDLDGVLAKYDGWKGAEQIGEPIPGALEFARSLNEFADIIIFTSRCSEDLASEPIDTARVRLKIIDWLDTHGFPYHDVYTGRGKPVASAFVDDRAVPCTPQNDPASFGSTLASARALITGKRRQAVDFRNNGNSKN